MAGWDALSTIIYKRHNSRNSYLPLLSSMMVTAIMMTASLILSLVEIYRLLSLLLALAPLLAHPLLARKERFTSGVPSQQ